MIIIAFRCNFTCQENDVFSLISLKTINCDLGLVSDRKKKPLIFNNFYSSILLCTFLYSSESAPIFILMIKNPGAKPAALQYTNKGLNGDFEKNGR